jgi:hypothetical protein
MRAKVRLLRHNGVRLEPAAAFQWLQGSLETESVNIRNRVTRRLVLRAFRACPGIGVIVALHQPNLAEVGHDAMRVRGLEEVQLEGGKVAAVLQEWLVSLG